MRGIKANLQFSLGCIRSAWGYAVAGKANLMLSVQLNEMEQSIYFAFLLIVYCEDTHFEATHVNLLK